MIAAIALISLIGQNGTFCPVTGSAAAANGPKAEYRGIAYTFCCGGCTQQYAKNPSQTLRSEKLKGKVVGVFLFDPVSREAISEKAAKDSSEFNGTRYYFASSTSKAAFDKTPVIYSAVPKKESLTCPVSGMKLKGYSEAGGYADYKGVRYYTCCGNCAGPFLKNPTQYLRKLTNRPAAPKAIFASK